MQAKAWAICVVKRCAFHLLWKHRKVSASIENGRVWVWGKFVHKILHFVQNDRVGRSEWQGVQASGGGVVGVRRVRGWWRGTLLVCLFTSYGK